MICESGGIFNVIRVEEYPEIYRNTRRYCTTEFVM